MLAGSAPAENVGEEAAGVELMKPLDTVPAGLKKSV
jgi:hypothetical protein